MPPNVYKAALLSFNPEYLPSADSLVPLADQYVNHRFKMLGSEWTHVYYGMRAPGFEGTNYSDPVMTFETAFDQLPAQCKDKSRELINLAARLVSGYEPIDWFIDYKSGYRYPMDHYQNLAYGLVDHVDAKVPYDVSRHYHLVILAMAWRTTGKEDYRKEILAQMMDWIAMNPYEYGIGWHYNMNVAIRAANWIVALSLIQDGFEYKNPDEAAVQEVLWDNLLQHRRYMGANLEFPETDFHPNHYIANLGGLLMTSNLLQDQDEDSKGWYRLALREIGLEIDHQFGEDGFNFEGTTSYHAFSLEMLIYPLIFTATASHCTTVADVRTWLKEHLGEARVDKIYRSFVALRDITQQNGRIPLIGDADAGRFLYLETPGHAVTDWKFLSFIGATLFEDPTLLPSNVEATDHTAAGLVFGTVVSVKEHVVSSAQFPDAGFYVMRDARLYSLIFCGPIGTSGVGGHAHDDKLSFTFTLDGKEFFVDPGVYVYTASRKYRQVYRSVQSHNTVCIEDEPQNRPLADSFWWGYHEDTRCQTLEWTEQSDHVLFTGEHQGYMRLTPPVKHRRTIEWRKPHKQFNVTDVFISGNHSAVVPLPKITATLMLHPACTVQFESPTHAVIQRDGIKINVMTAQGEWSLREGFFSPAYGVKQNTCKLVVTMNPGVAENQINLSW